MRLSFFKFHGLGNDFVLLEESILSPDCDLSALAIILCDRHFGVGADGLIIISRAKLQKKKANQDIYKVRFFNSDGSEAEMCGNGIRCAALYINKYLNSSNKITVKTLAGNIYPELFEQNGKILIKVDMGEPRLTPIEIPVSGFEYATIINQPVFVKNKKWYISAVSMGNPHCVMFVKNINNIDIVKYGSLIENDPHFPKKTNVEFSQVISPSYLKVKVWERGAGVTLACGTGACAVVVAGVLLNLCNRQTTVNLPGGDLEICWSHENNHIYLTGPATEVFKGELSLDIPF